MSATLTQLAWAVVHPRARRLAPGRHPLSRRDRRWFREQKSNAAAFGNPDAARLATLRVFDIDPRVEAGFGATGSRP